MVKSFKNIINIKTLIPSYSKAEETRIKYR